MRIDLPTVSVLRGGVVDSDDKPVPGVRVQVAASEQTPTREPGAISRPKQRTDDGPLQTSLFCAQARRIGR